MSASETQPAQLAAHVGEEICPADPPADAAGQEGTDGFDITHQVVRELGNRMTIGQAGLAPRGPVHLAGEHEQFLPLGPGRHWMADFKRLLRHW